MIRIKHLLFITLIVFCISICYFCLSYYKEFRKFAETNTGRELYFEEIIVNENLKSKILSMVDVNRYISERTIVKSAVDGYADPNGLLSELEIMRRHSPIIEDAILLDDTGRVVARATDNPERYIPTSLHEFSEAFAEIKEKFSSNSNNASGSVIFVTASNDAGGETTSLVYLHPVIVTDRFNGSVEIRGYLMSNIPLIKLVYQVTKNFNSSSVVRVSNSPLYDMEGFVSGFNILEIRRMDDEYICTLRVSVSRLSDEIEMSLASSIVSQVKKNVFISSVIAIALIVCFLFILHSFGQLFSFISRLEMGHKAYSEKFVIWEFNKTAKLLYDLKYTILMQLRDIERKNRGLQRANAETVEVNRKLANMNATLEKQVQERTRSLQNALELSTNCNNISNVIINQRSQLKDDMRTDEVFAIFCNSIREFNLKRNYCFEYKMEGESPVKINTIAAIIPPIAVSIGDSFCFEKGFYKFTLSMKEGEGSLVIEAQMDAIEIDILTTISVFCREVSSYLDNRALRNRLSFWARTDGLTKLGNRVAYDQQMSYFETCLDSEIGLFLIDVNGLKEMNDNKGHAAGDALLKRVAAKLQSVFDGYDADIFRIGGDEFITILHGKDLSKSKEILEKLAAVQDKPVPKSVDTGEIHATFAVGYADSRKTPFQMLYKQADHEMYIQKQEYYEMRHRLFGEVRSPRH